MQKRKQMKKSQSTDIRMKPEFRAYRLGGGLQHLQKQGKIKQTIRVWREISLILTS